MGKLRPTAMRIMMQTMAALDIGGQKRRGSGPGGTRINPGAKVKRARRPQVSGRGGGFHNQAKNA